MSEYQHGAMDIAGHEKTFEGFIKWMIRVGVISVVALVFMALFNS